MKRHFRAFGLAAVVFAAGFVLGGHAQSHKNAMNVSVQHFDHVEEARYPWGWIRWLMSSQLDHGAAQTFGIVEIRAGQKNSLHMHPNCEELLYVLSGSCRHRVGDKTVVLHAGDLVRIPPNTPHQATVIGTEPMRAVISYSSGDRQVVNLGPTKE